MVKQWAWFFSDTWGQEGGWPLETTWNGTSYIFIQKWETVFLKLHFHAFNSVQTCLLSHRLNRVSRSWGQQGGWRRDEQDSTASPSCWRMHTKECKDLMLRVNTEGGWRQVKEQACKQPAAGAREPAVQGQAVLAESFKGCVLNSWWKMGCRCGRDGSRDNSDHKREIRSGELSLFFFPKSFIGISGLK